MITRIKTYIRERRERKLRKELYFLIRKYSINHSEDYAKTVGDAVDIILRGKKHGFVKFPTSFPTERMQE